MPTAWRLSAVYQGATPLASYAYNGHGERVKKTVGADTTHYLYGTEGQLLPETDAQGGIGVEYVYLDGMPIALLHAADAGGALQFGDADNTLSAELNLQQITLAPAAYPSTAITVDPADWHDDDYGFFRFISFWGRDAQFVELSGQISVFDGSPSSAYVSRYQPPPRHGDYDLSASLGASVYSGSDPDSGAQATLIVDEASRTITVNEEGWPDGTYVIAETDWHVDYPGVYESITFTYTDGELLINGGILRSDFSNTAWLQTRQGESHSDSYSLAHQPAAPTGHVTYYIHTDHLDTPQLLTDEGQQVVWEARYLPFGQVELLTEQVEQNLRFPGQYFDAETGLWKKVTDLFFAVE